MSFLINPYVFSSPSDPNYASVALLLHADGASGSTTYVDNSPSPKSTLFAGATINTSTYKWPTGSASFNGVNQSIDYSDISEWDINIFSFTWEMWFYEDSTGGPHPSLVSHRGDGVAGTSGWVICPDRIRANINGTWSEAAQVWTQPAKNTWHHLAWVKYDTTLWVYIDGVLVHGLASVSSLSDTTWHLRFGMANQSFENPYKGFIDDIRYTPNVSRYFGGTTFTPPTRPFPNY